jgi:hypothetical protein
LFGEAEILGIVGKAAKNCDDTTLSVDQRAGTPEQADQERK